MRTTRDALEALATAATITVLASVAFAPAALEAQQDRVPTHVVVRAVAHDAKVIGSGVGGVRITIRDASTGRVLARGLQEGGTGDTEQIMRDPVARGESVYALGDAASFEATLGLDAPTRIEVEAEGPMDAPKASRQGAAKTLWVWPGRHLTGQGVVLELHGFLVEILSPEEGAAVTPGDTLDVEARVRMMCGCPTEPGGLWDADRFETSVRLLRHGTVVGAVPLRFAGEASHFRARVPVPEKGEYRLEVLVADTARANVGRAVTTVEAATR